MSQQNHEQPAVGSTAPHSSGKSLSPGTLLTTLVAVWVLCVCVLIEVTNFQADFYLPRQEFNEFGGLVPWRVLRPDRAMELGITLSDADVAEGRLRDYMAFGLFQYPLAGIVLLSSFVQLNGDRHGNSLLLARFNFGVALLALMLAFYRGYFTSLGG